MGQLLKIFVVSAFLLVCLRIETEARDEFRLRKRLRERDLEGFGGEPFFFELKHLGLDDGIETIARAEESGSENGKSGFERAKQTASDMAKKAGEHWDNAKQKAGEHWDNAKQKAGELADAAKEKLSSAGKKLSDWWSGSSDKKKE